MQNDANAQKIARHISKKVSDKLAELFQNDRKGYEEKWNSIGLFVHYGMLTDDKAYERLFPSMLFQDCDNKYFTFDEYRTLIESQQTDKDGNLCILYTTNKEEQFLSMRAATDKGYSVIVMDGPLALPLMNMLEQKQEKVHFARVDSDTIDRLIVKEEVNNEPLDQQDEELLNKLFTQTAPQEEGRTFHVQVATKDAASATALPVELIQGEWIRRMKDMSKFQQGMAFYGTLPDSFNLVVNASHPIVRSLLTELKNNSKESLESLQEDLKKLHDERAEVVKEIGDKKEEEIAEDLRTRRSDITKAIDEKNEQLTSLIKTFAEGAPQLAQLWDLALLSRGLLSGERLHDFMTRSYSLIKQ